MSLAGLYLVRAVSNGPRLAIIRWNGAKDIHKIYLILGFFHQRMGIMACIFSIQNLHFLSPQVSEYPHFLLPTFSRFNFIFTPTFLPQLRASFRCSLSINKLHSSSEHSFEVSYLMNTFGWPPEHAVFKARYLKFKTPEKPDRVMAFLKKNGFTETQISIIVKKDPLLLLSDPKNSLLPKYRFLSSLGLSRFEITSVVTQAPGLLRNSLERRMSDDEAIDNVGPRFLNLKTPEKPERVLDILKKHGFTKTQISHLVKKYPQLLLCDPETTLLPKFSFLSSLGLSRTEVAGVVAKAPQILKRSLEKRIVPAFNLILNLVKSDDEAVKMVKRYPMILHHNLEVDNIQILREAGVPEENIAASMIYERKGYTPTPEIYRQMVEEVKGMGFDPTSLKFLLALRTIRSVSKSTWEDKVQVFKKYGWSDSDVVLAFHKFPKFITTSKDKIEGVMDFLVNRMAMEATTIANWPNIFTMSLEKRIVPRCLVYQFVLEKGLCKRKLGIFSLCNYTENQFVTRVIEPYENEAPELWDLYNKLLDL